MAMKQPDERVCESVLRVRHLPEFAPFYGWLKGLREDARDRCEQGGPDEVTHRAQGAARVLKDVLDLIENADKHLEKVRPR